MSYELTGPLFARPKPPRDESMFDNRSSSILVQISGPDRPGVAAGLMDALSLSGAELQDVEQITIRGRLSLSLVITVPSGKDLLRDLLLFGWEHGVTIDFDVVEESSHIRKPGLIVTLIAPKVHPTEFGAVASVIAAHDGNIDRIVRLAKYPVMAYELVCSGPNLEGIRTSLLSLAKDLICDVAVHREGLGRRATRLVVLDVDSTLISDEVIELIADQAGCVNQVAEITDRAMRGDIDFAESLHERVALLKGLDASCLDEVRDRVRLTPGARTFIRTLRRMGYRTAIVSGGFTFVTEHLAAELGIDHSMANELEVIDGKLTGRVVGDIVDRVGKANFVREIAAKEGIPLDQVVAVGDGANDLDMLSTAGLGIAFNAKPIVRNQADTAVNVPYLDAVLFILGVRREEIEAADVAAGIDPTGPPVD